MNKYTIKIIEEYTGEYEFEATTKEEALEKAEIFYEEGGNKNADLTDHDIEVINKK